MPGFILIGYPGGGFRVVVVARCLPRAEQEGPQGDQKEQAGGNFPAELVPVEEIQRQGEKTNQGDGEKPGC